MTYVRLTQACPNNHVYKYNNIHEIARTSENISLLSSVTILHHTGKNLNALTLGVQTKCVYICMCIYV